MSDIAWCRTALNLLQEQLNRLDHQIRGFARNLGGARVQWQDAAAKEVFDRYLDPHQASLEELRVRLGQQFAELRQCMGRMEEASQPEQEVQRLSNESLSLRRRARDDLEIAHKHVDMALQAASDARHLAARASNILARIPQVGASERG
jgi:hypothetical protein